MFLKIKYGHSYEFIINFHQLGEIALGVLLPLMNNDLVDQLVKNSGVQCSQIRVFLNQLHELLRLFLALPGALCGFFIVRDRFLQCFAFLLVIGGQGGEALVCDGSRRVLLQQLLENAVQRRKALFAFLGLFFPALKLLDALLGFGLPERFQILSMVEISIPGLPADIVQNDDVELIQGDVVAGTVFLAVAHVIPALISNCLLNVSISRRPSS